MTDSSVDRGNGALGRSMALGHDWLAKAFIPEHDPGAGAGWPQAPGRRELTVWGGTLDGLRAARARRTGPATARERAALDWVRRQQVDCGGFDSCEIEYPAAETTAWALVTFGDLGLGADDTMVSRALTYLLECVAPGGGVTTTPDDQQDQRVMPMALSLWAFARYREELRARGRLDVIDALAERLQLVQDRQSGGWGSPTRTRAARTAACTTPRPGPCSPSPTRWNTTTTPAEPRPWPSATSSRPSPATAPGASRTTATPTTPG